MVEESQSGLWVPAGGTRPTLLEPAYVDERQQRFLEGLAVPPPHWGRTGAVLVPTDPRDYHPTDHPKVARLLPAAAPPSAERSPGVCEILNQGQTSACVPFSSCTGVQVDNNLDRGICYHFAAATLYSELGGTGPNGIDTRTCLQRIVDVGAPLLDGGRIKIGSYYRVDNIPGQFEEQIKAAVAAGMVVVIALLLPSTWSGKWTPGEITAGYHQVLVTGYQGRLFWGPNTWGVNWPGTPGGAHPAGFYECSFDYVMSANWLSGHTYAFFFDPVEAHAPIPSPIPTPTPSTDFEARLMVLVNQERAAAGLSQLLPYAPAAKAAHNYAITMGTTNHYDHHGLDGSDGLHRMIAAGMPSTGWAAWGENIAAGQSDAESVHKAWMESPGHKANILMPGFTHAGFGFANVPGSLYVNWWVENFVALTGVQPNPNPNPNPQPTGVTVTGYSANPVRPNQAFSIMGTNFFDDVVTVLWGGTQFACHRVSTTEIQATVPSVEATDSRPITVTVEGQRATGPALTVQVDTTPTPAPVTKRAVTGSVTGTGLETLAPGSTLAASGGSFSGALAIETISPLPGPQPDPGPGPGPGPSPEPSGLTLHHVGPQRGGIWLWVSDARETTVPATFTVTVNDFPLQGQVHSGPGAAAFIIGSHHGRAKIHVVADDGRVADFEGDQGVDL